MKEKRINTFSSIIVDIVLGIALNELIFFKLITLKLIQNYFWIFFIICGIILCCVVHFVLNLLNYYCYRIPDAFIAVILFGLTYLLTLIGTNHFQCFIKEFHHVNLSIDSDAIATIFSAIVVILQYYDGIATKLIITVQCKNGILQDSKKLTDNIFSFRCTNISNETINIRFLGWCKKEYKNNIEYKWELKDYIHSFEENLIIRKNDNMFVDSNEYTQLLPGDFLNMSEIDIKYNKELKKQPTFYLVFMDSIGKTYFKKINCQNKKS